MHIYVETDREVDLPPVFLVVLPPHLRWARASLRSQRFHQT